MNLAPTIRKAAPEDAAAFAACQYVCWQEAYGDLWDAARFAEIDQQALAQIRLEQLEAGDLEHYVAEVGDEVVGIAVSGASRDEDKATDLELYAIYVREAMYGTGIATLLLNAATGEVPVSLWVYRDNPRATAFYIRQGFIPDGAERVDPSGILELRFCRK
ncbi:GNAT family N-acetyltransferase [Nakamurella antarctica]|uniref:GNAT family N-acetyltransferase n=1 Tax=Nakamurella antarctica TaxID=1902245 RepID=A0A3G8ZM24_9ACTN|nr:GNAT family N-acetyltransferase [Nakamurella antarctica]AZI58280.1 GNAT family N-acetyltransferase [Nakamurella antarctica]